MIMALVALALAPLEFFVLQRVLDRPPGNKIESVTEVILKDVNTPHEPYSSIPPTSGPQVAGGAPWGIHHEPIPYEVQVANLSEGGVIVQYNCVPESTECVEIVRDLDALYQQFRGLKLIIAPALAVGDARIAMTALNRLEKLDAYRERPIVNFIEAYLEIPDE